MKSKREASETPAQEDPELMSHSPDQAALDEAARQGLALGEFEESEEEGVEVVEEFYPDSDTDGDSGAAQAPAPISLRGKLHRKQEALGMRANATGDPGASHAVA